MPLRSPSATAPEHHPGWPHAARDVDDPVALFDALDSLNALIEACKDGEFAFRIGAESAVSEPLRQALVARADEYRIATERLRAQVLHLGATPEDGGSTAGAMRRGWMVVRGRLATLDDEAILQDCEREEDATRAAFRDALARALPEPTASLVLALQVRARERYLPVRRLRDTLQQLA